MNAKSTWSGRRLAGPGILVVARLVLGACSGGGEGEEATSSTGASSDVVNVAYAGPLTGAKAAVGERMLPGAEKAVAAINAARGAAGSELNLVTGDTESTAQGAVGAINTLVNTDHVGAIAGPTSVTVMSVLNRIQEAGVPAIVIGGTTALDDTLKGETTWRTAPSDSLQGPAMVLAAVNSGHQNCALIFEDVEGAQSVQKTVDEALRAAGGTVALAIKLPVRQTDYRSTVLKLANSGADCVFFEISPDTAAAFWQSTSGFGELSEMYWVGNDTLLSDEAIAAARPVLESLEIVAVSPAAIGAGREDFVKLFDGEPPALAPLAYDAMNVLALAAEAAGSWEHSGVAAEVQNVSRDGEACTGYAKCKSLLEKGADIDYEGASGSCNINDTGNSVSGFGLFTIKGGSVSQVDTIEEEDVAALVSKLD